MKLKSRTVILTLICAGWLVCIAAAVAFRLFGTVKATPELLTPQPEDNVFYEALKTYDDRWEEWTFEHLYSESDVIVRGTATEQTEPVYRGWKTEVSVSKILKGECPESIFILEACGMNYVTDENPQWKNMYYSEDGYVLMQPGKEYVLFLKYAGGDIYAPTASGLAKFSVCEQPMLNPIDNSLVTYAEYLTYDYYSIYENVSEHYLSLHQQVQQMLLNNP